VHPPIPVQNLRCICSGENYILLKWDTIHFDDLAGYKICYDNDTTGFPYTNSLDVGITDTIKITNLDPGSKYYFSAITYDSSGNKSWYSNEVITIIQIPYSISFATICQGDSILLDGGTYQTASGSYYDTLNTINGCDSVIIINLTVNPTYYYTDNEEICDGDSLLWHSSYYLQSGTYYDSLQTATGCDSIYELSLSVMQNPSSFTISGKDTVVLDQTEKYTVPDSSNLTYSWNVENGIITDSLSNYEFSIQWNSLGTGYIHVVATNQHGCTSDTAELEVYIGSTDVIDIVNNKNIKIYPNPANENLVVLYNEDFVMEIYDLSGRKLIVSGKKETDISYLSKGIYFVKIVDKKGALLLKTNLVIN
jgi:hypothetical protein